MKITISFPIYWEILDRRDMFVGFIPIGDERIPFNLDLNLRSGQAFRWGVFVEGRLVFGKKDNNGYYWTSIGDALVGLKETPEGLYFISSKNKINTFAQTNIPIYSFLVKLFCRDRPEILEKKIFWVKKLFPQHVDILKGLVVLRQDPYETLLSFFLSPMNRVERISIVLDEISRKCGTEINLNSLKAYALPKPNQILKAPLDQIKFRFGNSQRKNLKNLAYFLVRNRTFLESLHHKTYFEAKEELMKINGVGEKVADCVLLYGFGFLQAVPIDTHIYQVSLELFQSKLETKKLTRKNYRYLGDMWRNTFGELAGFVQLLYYVVKRGIFR